MIKDLKKIREKQAKIDPNKSSQGEGMLMLRQHYALTCALYTLM